MGSESTPPVSACEIRTHLDKKLLFVGVLRVDKNSESPIFLSRRFNSSQIPFYKRKTLSDFANFSARCVSSRIVEGERTVLQEDGGKLYAMKWSNGLCIVCLTGQHYSDRVAFQLVKLVYDEFTNLYPSIWQTQIKDVKLEFPNLKEIMNKYNKPEDFDAIKMTESKVNLALNIVRSTVTDILKQGETVDALVERSKDLSVQTKKMFKRSKQLKRNSCCALM